jgi:sugar/nucleoside kinase (ribokinase family)
MSKDFFMGPGSSAIITDTGARDRSILTYRGIGDEIEVADVREKEGYLGDAEWHAVSSFSNADAFQALMSLLDLEKKNGIKLLFTPTMSMIGPLLDETIVMVKNASMVALNDNEAMMLTGTRDLFKAVEKIQNMGPESVMVTRGRRGMIVADKKKLYIADQTYDVEVRNTVGAGDLSAAAFWHFTQKGLDKASVIKRVLAAGAIKIQFAGAKMGLPEQKEVEEFMKEKGELPVQVKDR